jgi:hypothetical protein
MLEKWQFNTSQEIASPWDPPSLPPITRQNIPSQEYSPVPSRQGSLIETAPELEDFSHEELFGESEGKNTVNADLCGPQELQDGEPQPDVDIDPTLSLPFSAAVRNRGEGAIVAESPSTSAAYAEKHLLIVDGDHFSSAGEPASIETRATINVWPARVPHDRFLQVLASEVETADALLAVGLYESACDSYNCSWNIVWSKPTTSWALPFLVSMVSNMSRSVRTTTELQDVRAKMSQLIDHHNKCIGSDPRGEVALHTYLAILLLRFQKLSDAARHCEHALWIMDVWLNNDRCVLEDWRVHESMLHECFVRGPEEFRQLLSEKWRERLEQRPWGLLAAKLEHDETLQDLCASYASRLLLRDLCQGSVLAAELRAALGRGWDSQTLIRGLSISIFSHFWRTFAFDRLSWNQQQQLFLQSVTNISEKMQISRADVLATIALLLVNLTFDFSDGSRRTEVEDTKTPSCSIRDESDLLRNLRRAAGSLVSNEIPRADIMQFFLAAHTTISTTRVPVQAVPLARRTVLLGSPGDMDHGSDNTENTSANHKDLRAVSRMPTLNPTPCSSLSSGFRSMLSIHRRMKGSKAVGTPSNDDLSDKMSTLSFESWSIRHQIGLSNTSYKTLSSIDTESMRCNAMDWEPEAGKIQDNDLL